MAPNENSKLPSYKAKNRGRMALAGPQPLVREVLEVVGIATVIPVHGDVESACAALATP